MRWTTDLELIQEWLLGLDADSYDQAMAAIELLEREGPQLGRPVVDTVRKSQHANMKELRPGSARTSEIRILFAFDPGRQAILLLGGDKSGDWNAWYKRSVPVADKLFDDHLKANFPNHKKTKSIKRKRR